MSLFDIILVQPIFNVLLFIYGLVPGHDFGLAIILFTVLVRFAMWPLIRKQLHQTKVMQKIQPELQKIKKKTKGNRQLEAQLSMELYREKGVNPFGSIGLLIAQLPIFISLFAVIRLITENHALNIDKYAYGVVEQISYIKDVIVHPDAFNHMLFGVIDLTKVAYAPGGIYLPLMILAILAAGLQFLQSKQLLPQVKQGRKLRDILKDQAGGKDIDQGEISALMSSRMVFLFPVLTFVISIYLPGALVAYLLTTSAVAVAQQGYLLRQDSDELVTRAEKKPSSPKLSQKATSVQEAEVISKKGPAKTKRKKQGKK
jgi:YidC/Oxa1 family membrane protein insertase